MWPLRSTVRANSRCSHLTSLYLWCNRRGFPLLTTTCMVAISRYSYGSVTIAILTQTYGGPKGLTHLHVSLRGSAPLLGGSALPLRGSARPLRRSARPPRRSVRSPCITARVRTSTTTVVSSDTWRCVRPLGPPYRHATLPLEYK